MATLLGKIIADFTTALSTDIAVGGTSATLASATDDDGNALPSGRYFFTLDGSNSSKEHISCDLVGTALTNIKSLSRQGVETTGAVRKHRIGTSVSLTNHGHLKFINDLVSGTTTLNASAPLGYDAAPSSLAGNQLATVTYVLGVVNGGTVTFDKQVISGQTSGEALTANDIVYFKEADAKWYKVDADLTTTFDQLQMGVAQSTVSSNSTVTIGISGPMSGFTGLTAGSKYYASNTAGAITTTAGTYSVFVGWALSTTILLFDSVGKTLPTQKEKDALVGSSGVPSSTNKYRTQDNSSSATTDQTQTTQNSSIETGEANATTKKNKIAQSFIPTKTKISGVKLYKSADTGIFTGTVKVALQGDSTGSPSGSDLASVTLTNVQWIGLSVGEFTATFSTEYSGITTGNLYWVVITPSTSDNSNHPNIGTNTAGGYSSGSVKYNNTTDGWVAVSTIDLYFKTLEGVISQGVSTDSTGKIPQAFFDITKMPIPAFQQNIPLSASTSKPIYGFCSNQDGSILVVYNSTPMLNRMVRDTYTGSYIVTHNVTPTALSPINVGMVVLGSYIYAFYDGGVNVGCFRYDLATLANETAITFGTPIVASGSSNISAWTDGRYMYVVSDDANTTVVNLSISGTVLTQVTTSSAPSGTFAQGQQGTFFDGTTVYNSNLNSTHHIDKLTDAAGSAVTSTTVLLAGWTDVDLTSPNSFVIVNIDTTRMYVGRMVVSYDETAIVANNLYLIPITKP